MKFKTRLYVTFTTIVMLPLALTALAFCAIGLYLMNVQKGLPVAGIDYTDAAQNMREVINTTDKAYYVLRDQAAKDPSMLAKMEY